MVFNTNDKLCHIILYHVHLAMNGARTLVAIGTDYTGSCKSNYHTITTTISLGSGTVPITP
jgi:hypothetical protein